MGSLIRLFGSALSAGMTFASNGLGVLSEAISCIVTEERNGEFELSMEYPITGKLYDKINLRNIIVADSNPYSKPQPFRIYSISRPINGVITINAEHISYDLSGYAVKVLESPAYGVRGYFEALNNRNQGSDIIVPEGTCPFTFETNDLSGTEFKIEDIVSVRNALGEHSGSILDSFNGEYEWDGLTVKFYRLTKNPETGKYTEGGRGEDTGVSIRYGKNLTSFEQEENCQKVYTGVYPYWHYDEYRHDLVELPYPHYVSAPGTYDYVKILPLDVTGDFARKPSTDQLTEYATSYMEKNDIGVPDVSFDVEFVPLAQTTEYKDYAALEKVHLCDTINVFFPLLNVNAKAKVTKTEYDSIGGKYKSISLGNYKTGISDTVVATQVDVQEKPTSSMINQAILEATELLTGQTGGYVILNNPLNNPDSPNEILVASSEDLDDNETCVWRWNQNGLGFSSTGYNGQYETAITSDGHISASFITTGVLNGDVIKAGSITADKLSVEYTNDINQKFTVADGQIANIISRVNELGAYVGPGDGSLTELVSSLEQDITSLRLSFSSLSSGGINKIQNSSGLNGVSSDWLESSTGVARARQDAEEQGSTDSGSAFEIRNGTLSQTIKVHVGEYYTFGLRYKSFTSARSYAYIRNGDAELYAFDRTQTSDWSTAYLSEPFQAVSDQVDVVCGTSGDYLLVADLMLASGKSRQNWTPAPNEIYTTNVKIDRTGINITNEDSDTRTLIDNTKFAVYYQDNEVLTVNQAITKLQKTEVNELTIGVQVTPDDNNRKAKFVKVEDGVDLVILV